MNLLALCRQDAVYFATKNGITPTIQRLRGWAIVLILSAATACNQNMKPLPGTASTPETVASNTDGGSLQSGGMGTVSGTISVAPALSTRFEGSAVLFIIARRGGGGPPLAVKKIDHPQFPLSYTLSRADVMLNEPFGGEIMVVARLDKDGSAGPPQPGDMEGTVPHAHVGDAGVNIVIDRMH